MTREEFRFLAAGRCVYGKGAVDPKHLELYVEGAMMSYDFLTKKKIETREADEKSNNDTRSRIDEK